MKKIIFGAIVFLCLFTTCVKANPDVTNISLNPANPKPLSTITFTATITGDQIDEAYMLLVECNEKTCFQKVNESMTMIEPGKYQADITLSKSSSTYIQYWVEYNEGGKWTGSEDDFIKKNLNVDQDDSPGFELLVFLISIIILIFIIKKKRR